LIVNRRTKSRFLARPFDFAQGRLSPCIARLRTARNDNFGDCGGMAEAVPFPSPPSRFVSAVPPGLTRSQAYPGLASWAVIFPPLRGCAASLSAPQWTSRSKVEVRIRAGFSAVPLGLMTNWRAQVGGRGRPPHTGITQAFAPPPKALPADPAQSDSSYLQHRRRRTPGHRSSRNKSRIYPKSPRPWRRAARSRSSLF